MKFYDFIDPGGLKDPPANRAGRGCPGIDGDKIWKPIVTFADFGSRIATIMSTANAAVALRHRRGPTQTDTMSQQLGWRYGRKLSASSGAETTSRTKSASTRLMMWMGRMLNQAREIQVLDPEWDDDAEFLSSALEAIELGRPIDGVAPLSPWVSEMEAYKPIRAPRRKKKKSKPSQTIGPGNLFKIVNGPATQDVVYECIKIVDDRNWGLVAVYQTPDGLFAEPVGNCNFP